jgi:hypothetical protein
MFILTDGKNYVMENPVKIGCYVITTSPVQAKEFTFKQARSLLRNRSKKLSWIGSYYMVNQDDGEVCDLSLSYKGNNGVYIGDNDIVFDENLVDVIYEESKSIIKLEGWNISQLKVYKEKLNMGLSKYDSAESDIMHALQKYKEDNNGKRPQAHKMANIGYVVDEIREKRKKIKQCLRYIQIMENAVVHHYTVEKLKLELQKSQNGEYKGRTEYYKIALQLLE